MINNEENNIFPFIKEDSFISYKKVPLITSEIQKLSEAILLKNKELKPSFFYDKYTNQFIYINGEAIIILDSKCKIKAFSRIEIEQKIKTVSLEYNNKYLLYTTYDCKSFIINILDLDTIDCIENKKAQYIGGFFIPHKSENKEHDYFILCMISRTYFNISRIFKRKNKYNSFDYNFKKSFISSKMKIIDFNFNHIFKLLLIIKAEPLSFCLYNLKSKHCYKTPLIINNIIINENCFKLFLQNIYNKLYLIYLNNPFIEVYRLNNLNEIKEPIKIKFNSYKNKIKLKNIILQFYNNLIIIYLENYIKVYDIKNQINSYEVFSLNLVNKEYFNVFYKARIFGKYLLINNIFYKIKFLNLTYKKYSKSSLKDIFFTILRRRNTNKIIKNMLFEILNNSQISLFFEILEQIVMNNKKYIQKKSKRKSITDKKKERKKDPFNLIYIGNNSFFLSEDYILGLFNQSFDKNIRPEIFLKILGRLYNIYFFHNIYLDINLYYSTLFCFLNKIDNLNIMEYIIKNKIIPINKELGNYFLIRAKGFKDLDLDKYKHCYNIGIDILMNENNYDEKLIKNISEELINNGENSQAFNLLYDSFFVFCNSQKDTKK